VRACYGVNAVLRFSLSPKADVRRSSFIRRKMQIVAVAPAPPDWLRFHEKGGKLG
jgi:hypothetical protein